MSSADFKHLVDERVPVLAALGLTVEEVSPVATRLRIAADPSRCGHGGGIHPGVLFTAAESCALALGFAVLEGIDVTCHSKAAEIRFRKPLSSDLWATAQLPKDLGTAAELSERLTAEGKLDVPILVEIADAAGTRAADATVTVTLRRR